MDPEFPTFFLVGVPRETWGKWRKTFDYKKAEYFQKLRKYKVKKCRSWFLKEWHGGGEYSNKLSFTFESVSEKSVHLRREISEMHQNIEKNHLLKKD